LNVLIQSQDSDQDPVTHVYRWMKNDEEIIGENTYALRNGNFKKGDLIKVNVTPSDGKVKGETFVSPSVEILNSPPVIKGITIEPKVAYVNDDLKAFVQGYDADGDSINYTYHWERNGAVLSEENTSALAANRFKKGDSIAVTVIPHDGEISGTPKKTEPITMANSPPIITSIPPTRTVGNSYTYQVKANDADNDPVIFSLRTAPEGMTIDKEGGIIRWDIREGDKRTHTIEIEVSDSDGATSFQRYTLSVELK
jgi:Putative Ig domain